MTRRHITQSVTTWLLFGIPSVTLARSWMDIVTYHPTYVPDTNTRNIESDPFDFGPVPTLSPTRSPTVYPWSFNTEPPTIERHAPTWFPPPPKPRPAPAPAPQTSPVQNVDTETGSPAIEPWPPNPVPMFPRSNYFNYDDRLDAKYGPGYPYLRFDEGFTIAYENNAWADIEMPSDFYWAEFDTNGFGAWNGALASRNPTENQCGTGGMQSPIDVRMSGVACIEHHQIRTRPGDFRLSTSNVQKLIESNKLRLLYPRRPCPDLLDPDCAEPDPPAADFPTGWGGFADMMHVDFKFPAEHRINGETFDGEMQIFHLHPGRRRVPAISSLMRVQPDGHNAYLQTAIDAFQYEYNLHRAQCADKTRRERKLVTDFHLEILKGNSSAISSFTEHYETWAEFSTQLDDPDFVAESEQHRRRMQSRLWHPHHEDLIPTYWFYGYDGSLTEPPCSEFVSWFIMDRPMIIGPEQLEQMKNILFTHVDEDCQATSVHYGESVARPIQESAGRQVWRCTEANYLPDSERNK